MHFLLAVLFSLFIPINSELSRDDIVKCWHRQNDFMSNFYYRVMSNFYRRERFTHTDARNLSSECYEVAKCPPNTDVEYIYRNTGMTPYSKDFCPLLDVYKGPLGVCLDKIRDRDNTLRVMNCVWDSIDRNNITDNTPWFGPDDPRSYDFMGTVSRATCYSINNNCTISLIDKTCEPGSLELLLENMDTFNKANCTGVEVFDGSDWRDAVEEELERLQWEKYYGRDDGAFGRALFY